MPTWAWVLIAVLVLAIVVLVVVAGTRRRQSTALKDRFGPEYERAVEQHGDRHEAERELGHIAEQRDKLDIRPLSAESHRVYLTRWEAVQSAFVDQPYRATAEADVLITEVMRERGYPVDRFDERANLISADHPDVVDHYRSAHAISRRGDSASTEDLRQAFVHYRALFDRMLHDRDDHLTDVRTDEARTAETRRAEGGPTA